MQFNSDPDNKDIDKRNMEDIGTTSLSDLRGKAIISIENGENIGQVDDVFIDPRALRVSGVTIARGGVFDREIQMLSADRIEKWGRDAILVQDAGVLRNADNVPGSDEWFSAHEKLNGLGVVTSDGERIGQISDILIDYSGRMVAYRITEGFGQGVFGNLRDIPAHNTRTLGKDVVIIDVDRPES